MSFRTWWRVTWCMPSVRRSRCWKSTSKSCTRGTLCWSARTPCWSRWPARTSSGSCPNSSLRAATAHHRCYSSSSSTRSSQTAKTTTMPPCHNLRGVRVFTTSPTSRQREPCTHPQWTYSDTWTAEEVPVSKVNNCYRPLLASIKAKGSALHSSFLIWAKISSNILVYHHEPCSVCACCWH